MLDLFSNLCRKKIGTNSIVNQCKQVCSELSENRERQLLQRVMNYLRMNAIKDLQQSRRENTKVWQKARCILIAHDICNDYLVFWYQEGDLYRVYLRHLLNSKVSNLTKKYFRKYEIPDVIRGITVKDQQIPVDFSMQPKCYRWVTLSQDERSALALPPKFATYSKIDSNDGQVK